ncbi:putative mitochondrial precursor protein import receptor tom70 [Tilletiaria anomala UBC 951]|uniref:Putative mitochondrial protein import receptor tom70 n=1 Tax=Tilletiaria anomala (strain ATCC 24038 / CBS 436.72 / UBC 951) TaxID=1037660 RepID=A0A066V984_TILAU|nr:putative mitochondrial precursor protein import receptor tom70 [Tilletiaria anomala UBC 951]KDN38046.1 putative mitochondrial precursor protein import receptor tom70 [Tilletiaria anomala UBC 951]
MAPAVSPAHQQAERAADVAQSAGARFTRWLEDNRYVLMGAAAGVGAAGLAYYLISGPSSPPGGRGGDASSSSASVGPGGEKGGSSKKKNKKKKASNKKDGERELPGDGPLLEEASDAQIIALSAEEIARLPGQRRKDIAQALKTAGNKAYSEREYEKAIQLYTKAIAADPLAVFYSNRAACYNNLGRYLEVIDDCNEALKQQKDYVKALNRRATAREKLGGDGGSGGESDEKMQSLIRSAEDFTAVAILSRFKDAAATQAVERVLNTFARARAGHTLRTREPRLPSPTFVIAYLDAFRKKPVPALPAEPSQGDKTLKLAYEALAANNFPHAFSLISESLDQGLSTDDLKANALNMRATFQFVIGNAPSALEDLDESTRLVPSYVQSWVKKASVHMELGQREEAFNDFERAIQADPSDPDIYYHRGQVHFILQQFDEALKDYSKSTELDDSFIFSQVQYAVAQYKLNKLPQSKRSFERILAKFSNSSEAYNYCGELQLDQQEFESALENFNRAIALEAAKANSSNVLPMINKALLLFQWKTDLAGAEELCRKALEIDPDCDVAVATLAQLCLQQGRIPESIEFFARSAQIARTEPELINAITYEQASRAQASFIEKFPEQGADLAALAGAMP